MLRVLFKEFLKLFKCLASSSSPRSLDGWISSSKIFTKRKEKKGENSHKDFLGILSCDSSPPIFKHFLCRFFIKTS